MNFKRIITITITPAMAVFLFGCTAKTVPSINFEENPAPAPAEMSYIETSQNATEGSITGHESYEYLSDYAYSLWREVGEMETVERHMSETGKAVCDYVNEEPNTWCSVIYNPVSSYASARSHIERFDGGAKEFPTAAYDGIQTDAPYFTEEEYDKLVQYIENLREKRSSLQSKIYRYFYELGYGVELARDYAQDGNSVSLADEDGEIYLYINGDRHTIYCGEGGGCMDSSGNMDHPRYDIHTSDLYRYVRSMDIEGKVMQVQTRDGYCYDASMDVLTEALNRNELEEFYKIAKDVQWYGTEELSKYLAESE